MVSETLVDFAPDAIDDKLFSDACKGIEAERFLESKVGRMVRDKAVAAYEEYVTYALDDIHPDQMEERRKEAIRARDALNWLVSAVVEGEQAQAMLRERDAVE